MATSIWGSNGGVAATPVATNRIPTDISSSGPPNHHTLQQVADLNAYVGRTVQALGSVGTNQSVAITSGAWITATATGNIQFTFTSVPASGLVTIVLQLTNGGLHTISFAASVTWTAGTAPTLQTAGTDIIVLYTTDGGTSYLAHIESDEQTFSASAITSGTLALARGGTGASLTDPNADRLMFWDDSAGAVDWLTVGSGLSISGTTIMASAAAAGSDTQVQFNDGGTAFGGDSGFTFNKTNKTVDLGGGTVTTSDPVLNLSQTWNAGAVTFTGLKFNVTSTAAAAASKVFDFQVGGTQQLALNVQSGISFLNGPTASQLNLSANGANLIIGSNGYTDRFGFAASSGNQILSLGTAQLHGLSSAHTIEQRNSTNAQTFRVYGTYTDASNYVRLAAAATSTATTIAAETAGTGADDVPVSIIPAGAAGVILGASGNGAAKSTNHYNKSVTGIADATATDIFTVTVPNAAHSASIEVVLTCSLGAGGAIGTNEATGTVIYNVSVARTAGVNAVATISTAYGSSTSSVAGAATITVTGDLGAVSGAVGATNTFTIRATVTRGSGSSTNHTCVATARLLNANASGITIS